MVAKVIEAERPDALLPTLGGQTGLEPGHGSGAARGAGEVRRRDDRRRRRGDRQGRGARPVQAGHGEDRPGSLPRRDGAHAWTKPAQVVQEIGLPCVVRPSFTLGGSGSAIAYNREEFDTAGAPRAGSVARSPRCLLEESVLGWKEYEMEVMRDVDDNVVIICSIENFDPMGVHTGDSITVAPAQTLTDKEYQRMRDASLAVIREIGVETGGSNIQFAIHPQTGRMVVIEMNPRVSRSSALASKATGFPIAKIAAKLAVGYRLHELPNDITRETQACFEPTIDYVVTKIPRFAFEKFPEADATLTTQMKSVGETMAIGRTFKESFQKALRGLEVGSFGFGCDGKDLWGTAAATELAMRFAPSWPRPTTTRLVSALCDQGRHDDRRDPRTDGDRSAGSSTNLTRDRRAGRDTARQSSGWRPSSDDLLSRPSSSASPIGSWPRFGIRTEMDVRSDRKQRGHRGDVQVGRYLRRRVRSLHAVLLLDLRRRRRNAAQASQASKRIMILGGGPEPHRPGHRVRLLLLPRQLRAARDGHRVDHGQLEPGDGQHRLRHQRSAVLRAADDRGRAEHLRPRAAGWRDRAVRRPDAAESGPGAGDGRRADHRHQRRHDRRRRRPREVPAAARTSSDLKQPANGIARTMDAGPSARRRRSAFRRWCGPASCSAAGRWRSATTRRSSNVSWPRRSSSPRASRC